MKITKIKTKFKELPKADQNHYKKKGKGEWNGGSISLSQDDEGKVYTLAIFEPIGSKKYALRGLQVEFEESDVKHLKEGVYSIS